MDSALVLLLAVALAGVFWLTLRLNEANQRRAAADERARELGSRLDQADEQNREAREAIVRLSQSVEQLGVGRERLSDQNQQLSAQKEQRARELHQEWRRNEIENVRREQKTAAALELATWKADEENKIRADAIQKSRSTITGQVTEHIVPHLPGFTFNPKDARFIGSPIDFVVFDGLDQDDLRDIVFIEVKTGTSGLTPRERQVRQAVLERKVKWVELRKDTSISPIGAPRIENNQLKSSARTHASPAPAISAPPKDPAARSVPSLRKVEANCNVCGTGFSVTLLRHEHDLVCPECGHHQLIDSFNGGNLLSGGGTNRGVEPLAVNVEPVAKAPVADYLCPKCGARNRIDPELVGQRNRCSSCHLEAYFY
jgi:predicted Holliday junction resolvase-like endonuclease/DNA-directed RNA polymerase subunit RPC12/RpoP